MPEFEPLDTLEHKFPEAFQGFSPKPFDVLHAWRLNIPARLASDGLPPESDACVASWIIQAPWAHPTWNSYWLLVMHLRQLTRDGEPFKSPHVYLEGATHELHLHALNPDHQAEAMARYCEPHRLLPANFGAQLVLPDDDAALALAGDVARDVLEGRLNPDTDARSQWIARFGANMLRSC